MNFSEQKRVQIKQRDSSVPLGGAEEQLARLMLFNLLCLVLHKREKSEEASACRSRGCTCCLAGRRQSHWPPRWEMNTFKYHKNIFLSAGDVASQAQLQN